MKTQSLLEILEPIVIETQRRWEEFQIALDKIKYQQKLPQHENNNT